METRLLVQSTSSWLLTLIIFPFYLLYIFYLKISTISTSLIKHPLDISKRIFSLHHTQSNKPPQMSLALEKYPEHLILVIPHMKHELIEYSIPYLTNILSYCLKYTKITHITTYEKSGFLKSVISESFNVYCNNLYLEQDISKDYFLLRRQNEQNINTVPPEFNNNIDENLNYSLKWRLLDKNSAYPDFHNVFKQLISQNPTSFNCFINPIQEKFQSRNNKIQAAIKHKEIYNLLKCGGTWPEASCIMILRPSPWRKLLSLIFDIVQLSLYFLLNIFRRILNKILITFLLGKLKSPDQHTPTSRKSYDKTLFSILDSQPIAHVNKNFVSKDLSDRFDHHMNIELEPSISLNKATKMHTGDRQNLLSFRISTSFEILLRFIGTKLATFYIVNPLGIFGIPPWILAEAEIYEIWGMKLDKFTKCLETYSASKQRFGR